MRDGLPWCEPTGYARDRVRYLETGVWGFAFACREDNDDHSCGCAIDGRASSAFVQIRARDPGSEGFTSYLAVLEDGTFLLEGVPGREYDFEWFGHHFATEDGPIRRLVLEEGEVVFGRLIVHESC